MQVKAEVEDKDGFGLLANLPSYILPCTMKSRNDNFRHLW
jgi:hypothetical protein